MDNEHRPDFGEGAAAGMGPARGAFAAAFRSEGHDMLAVLRYLFRLAEFTGQALDWDGIVATNSERLLDTVFENTTIEQETGRHKCLRQIKAHRCAYVRLRCTHRDPGRYLKFIGIVLSSLPHS